jgi:predicted DsbA family dithiol-disulfide isomerase
MTVLHWYDFICPFCYVGQQRNAILARRALKSSSCRFRFTYAMLEREAAEASLPLKWPQHLPNARRALAAAESVRRHQPMAFPRLHHELFEAHLALGEDLEDPAVIDAHASASGVDLGAMHAALANGSAARALAEAEENGREHGVMGTPARLLGGELIVGLRLAAEFERLARSSSWLPSNPA